MLGHMLGIILRCKVMKFLEYKDKILGIKFYVNFASSIDDNLTT